MKLSSRMKILMQFSKLISLKLKPLTWLALAQVNFLTSARRLILNAQLLLLGVFILGTSAFARSPSPETPLTYADELVDKAAVYGARCIVSISAPTSYAVDRARLHDITLLAVARRDGLLAFHGAERVRRA